MFNRFGVVTGLFVFLAVGGCGRSSGTRKYDGGSLGGDGAALDGALRSPDSVIAASPDLSPDRLIPAADSGADSTPDRPADASPDNAGDTAIDRSADVADLGLPDRGPDGPAADRALARDRGTGDAGGEAPPPGLSVLAGALGGAGGLDGVGPSAQFYFPEGAALDGAGNLYMADSQNHTIRKMVLATRKVSTVAGLLGESGSADGVGSSARFSSPEGLAADASGNLYIADSDNHTIRKMVLASGQVTTIAGSAGQADCLDGRGSAARFAYPTGLALDGKGNLYVSDQDNTIRRIALATGEVTTVAGQPSPTGYQVQDGPGATARFNQPHGLAADSAGNLYVADTQACTIRKIELDTTEVTTILGDFLKCGNDEGIGTKARFSAPEGLALDGAGNLYVADYSNGLIRKVVLATGAVSNLSRSGEFGAPSYLAYDGTGSLYVTDGGTHTVLRYSLATQSAETIAGQAIVKGGKDGVGAEASFSGPTGMASDDQGGLFVANSLWNSIRRIDLHSGRVTTLAGSLDGSAGSTDGTGTDARFTYPSALAYDGQGILYVADSGNSTIRKIELDTGTVTTFAGTRGARDTLDGKGTSAHFSSISGLALDGAGNLLVAESIGYIRKVALADATVSYVAGNPVGGFSDGTRSQVLFARPSGLACDGAGNLYVADAGNCVIRQVVIATGSTSTLVGAPRNCEGKDGTGSAARFREPVDVAMDLAGRLVVADRLGHTIRRIDLSTKEVTTIVGQGGERWLTIPGPLPASISTPAGLAVLPSGDIAISEWEVNVILLAHF